MLYVCCWNQFKSFNGLSLLLRSLAGTLVNVNIMFTNNVTFDLYNIPPFKAKGYLTLYINSYIQPHGPI